MNSLSFPYLKPAPAGEMLEVAPNIFWLRLPLPWVLDHVNAYALKDEDGWTIIDTGIWNPDMMALWPKILADTLGGLPVRRVVATHHHLDHVGMVGWLVEQGAQFYTSKTAFLYGRMLWLDRATTLSKSQISFFHRAGLPQSALDRRIAAGPSHVADDIYEFPSSFIALEEGDVFHAAGRDWHVRLGQGHAPDHLTFWSDDVVIAGDQLLPGISPNIGVYPSEPDANPLAGWLESCERFAKYATPDQLILSGHKLPYRGLPFRLQQLGSNHHHALERLLDFLKEPRSAVDCFSLLFKREINQSNESPAVAEAVAHVNYLWHEGLVSRELAADGVYRFQRC